MRVFSEDGILSTNTPFGTWANPVEFFLNPQSEIIRDFRGRHDVCESDSTSNNSAESHCKETILKIRKKYSQKGIARPQSQFPHSCFCERICPHDRSAYSAAGKYVKRSWEYINCSQTHECGNWDWGRAFPFLEKYKWDFRCSAQHIRDYSRKQKRAIISCLLVIVHCPAKRNKG